MLMCHDSGSSFRAAVPRKSPSMQKRFGTMNGDCWTGNPWTGTRLLLLCVDEQDFSIPVCWPPPSGAGLAEPLTGSTSSAGSGTQRGREPRKGGLPCIDRLLHAKERHSKQERRNKSNKFITTWPKRSERDKSPPVVRRSAVERPPPNRAWVKAAALDMGQAAGRRGGRTSLRTKTLLLFLVAL